MFYQQNSYNLLSIGPVTITPLLRMPQPTSEYVTSTSTGNGGYRMLLDDAINAAVTAGYDTTSYGNVIISFSMIYSWAGILPPPSSSSIS
jgi:hypothetical protein